MAGTALRHVQGPVQLHPDRRALRRWIAGALLAAGLLLPAPAHAYSVLAHESTIDALWAARIRPLLLARYPHTSAAALGDARAYAYGGSVVQDLGYYPFGSHFFTNLVHYVKTGDFVEALLRDARDVNEYAFAIGALCHYASDSEGHRIAVNRAVPLIYPKLRRKFGDVVPYDEAKKEHVLVEFAFDVLLVAHGGYELQSYHDFIGFKVAKPLLERAFRETYGFEMKDIFMSEDLALGTFRHAVGTTIPNVTTVAWDKKREQIEKTTPGIVRDKFVLSLPRAAYEKAYGTDYRKPRGFAKLLGWLYVLVPKIGPLRPLAFKVPTPEAEALFLDSLTRSRQRFAAALDSLRDRRLDLPNINLDLGRVSAAGEYPLADETRREFAERREGGR